MNRITSERILAVTEAKVPWIAEVRLRDDSARIERLTRETVEKNFAAEIASGRIVLNTINLDGPGNEHFVQDYQLISKTVIVSDRAKGQEVQWENLQEVWSKQKDEQAFEAYVVDAVRRHLGSVS